MSPGGSVAATFDSAGISQLTDHRSYLRGMSYLKRVESLAVTDERASATVRGTVPYAVELWVAVGPLAGRAPARWATEATSASTS